MKKFFSSKKRNAILTAVSFGICFANFSITTAETPSFFDWRLNNPTDSTSGADSLSIVSPVEDQGDYGTCWTFGTFASYESSWLTTSLRREQFFQNFILRGLRKCLPSIIPMILQFALC